MNTRQPTFPLLIAVLLCLVPARLCAQEASSPLANTPSDSSQGRTIGVPQVLEIPPVQESSSPPATDLSVEALPPAHERALGMGDPNDDSLQQDASSPVAPRRTYLGVLYATAEEGPVGVKVLDVVQGSPAARAGFQGINSPTSQSNDLIKAALVVLAMSPVGPFAIPLVIAHDIYTASQSPGDLIVAVGNQQVHDAQEFSEQMHHYQPGDTVSFSVVRRGKTLQIAVQLEEEPS